MQEWCEEWCESTEPGIFALARARCFANAGERLVWNEVVSVVVLEGVVCVLRGWRMDAVPKTELAGRVWPVTNCSLWASDRTSSLPLLALSRAGDDPFNRLLLAVCF